MSRTDFPNVKVSGWLLRSPQIMQLPNSAARWGWINVLATAAWLQPSGYFDSERMLKGACWYWRSYVKSWLAAGLLERGDALCADCQSMFPAAKPDGLVVHRWQDHRVPSPREPISREHRIAVAAAFAGQCAYCGRTDRPMHIDHRVPVARGGKSDPDNLVLACRDCNLAKKDDDPANWPVRFGPVA